MDFRRFVFCPAKIIESDIGRNALEFINSDSYKISNETAFLLLEILLMRTSIRLIYKELKYIYEKKILFFSTNSEYVVENVLGKSVIKNIVYYLVKWEGWPPPFNSWEPEDNLVGCEHLIKDFISRNSSPVDSNSLESPADKQHQVIEVLDRLKEALPLSEISPLTLLRLFHERLARSDSIIRPFWQPKCKINTYVEGTRPKPPKRLRLTAKSEVILKESVASFQQMLNRVYSNEAPITVENDVDLEYPPSDFQPINDYVPHHDVYLPTKAVVGCECSLVPRAAAPNSGNYINPVELESCWINRHNGCCAVRAGARVPYTARKRLNVPPGHAVFECNSACGCGPTCPFRVVQLGRKIPVSIFRTNNSRGWGVKSLTSIPKGTFVMEYLGEIITFDGAEKRGMLYDKQRMTYLFDLDFEDEAQYTVDAFQMGNVSHFVNHCCDPNLTVRCVFIECLNTKLPRLALFASRLIHKNEELTFDYQMTGARDGTDEENIVEVSIDDRSECPNIPDLSMKSPSFLTNGELKAMLRTSPRALNSECSSSELPDNLSEISSASKNSSLVQKKIKMKCLCGSKLCRGYLVS